MVLRIDTGYYVVPNTSGIFRGELIKNIARFVVKNHVAGVDPKREHKSKRACILCIKKIF